MSRDVLFCSFTNPVLAVPRGNTEVPSDHGGVSFSDLAMNLFALSRTE